MATRTRKHQYISIALVLVLFIIPTALHAANFGLAASSIGGRIKQDPPMLSAELVCSAAYGPFNMNIFNVAVPGPFFIRSATSGIPRLSSYLLGNYSIIPDLGTCVDPATGTPKPAFEIKLYGTSR